MPGNDGAPVGAMRAASRAVIRRADSVSASFKGASETVKRMSRAGRKSLKSLCNDMREFIIDLILINNKLIFTVRQLVISKARSSFLFFEFICDSALHIDI